MMAMRWICLASNHLKTVAIDLGVSFWSLRFAEPLVQALPPDALQGNILRRSVSGPDRLPLRSEVKLSSDLRSADCIEISITSSIPKT